jgi:Protein of unknown function (DUF1573)
MISRKEILFLVIIISIAFVSCSLNKEKQLEANHIADAEGVPEIKFDTTYHDFGTLVQGEQVAFTFKFVNRGSADLIIYDAFSTCGCTVPEYSKEPVSPGAEGKIEVVFNSEGKRGMQYKSVTLKLNTVIKEKTLTIKANVLANNYKS